MKRHSCLLVLLLLTHSVAAAPWDLRRAGRVDGDAAAGAAQVGVCVACHGPEGNPRVAAFPALAGQQAAYLYQSLVGFRRRNEAASPMTAQVSRLNDSDMRNIAAYFAAQPRRRDGAAVPPADPVGAQLFRDGDSGRGIAPCQACHGERAQGHPLAGREPRYAYYPVLAGQQAEYLAARLRHYRDRREFDSSNAYVMHGVARVLDDVAIRALADWLSALPP